MTAITLRLGRARRWRFDAILGTVLLGVICLAALAAPLIAPFDPNQTDIRSIYHAPGGVHLLGTDEVGRDVLSRVIYGARVSLLAGLEAMVIAATIGISTGLLAGYRGGRTERILQRLNDGLMSLPGIVLALAFVAVLGPGLVNGMLVVGIVLVPRFFRVTRATTRDVKENQFIEASVNLGCPPWRVVVGHILPNIFGPLVVEATLVLSAAILIEASLSFLGLGAPPPTASWGSMLATAQRRPDLAHLVFVPGVALTLTVLALSLCGDALRDAVNGRGRSRA
jgi:peptide/nickel transport system permease protein